MTALVVTVLLASLVGSLHCAGMCGVFVAISVGEPSGSKGVSHLRLQIAYHGGRLLTYVLLGAAAGFLGAALDLGGAYLGVQRVALVAAGAAMVVFGVVALLRLRGVRVPTPPTPALLRRAFAWGQRSALAAPPVLRALSIGLLSTFLPCGWLYAFAVTAAGTGSAMWGAMAMGVFWLGTVPVLAGIGLGVQHVAGPLRRHAPAVTAVALVIVGLLAIFGRFRIPALAVTDPRPASIEELADRVRSVDAESMPCHGQTD